MNIYECPKHDQDFQFGKENGCSTCYRLLEIINHNKEVHARTPRVAKLQESVYWPSEMGHNGRLIENLEHRPKFFALKRQYRDYLKQHNIREAG